MKLNLPYSPTPENAPKIAAFIVEQIKQNMNLDLDYSADSLKLIDSIIENIRQRDLSLEMVASDLFCFGCYVGEVFLKAATGQWKNTAETKVAAVSGMPLVIEMSSGGIGNPIGKVFKCYENGSVDSLAYYFQAFSQRNKK
jgi:hypothetical protein